jgi:hypothetical protein
MVSLADGTPQPGIKLISKLWERSGSKSGEWKHAYVTVPPVSIDSYLRFAAAMTTTRPSYAALDDVRLTLAACPRAKYCDFESDMCGFENDVSSRRKWLRIKSADAVVMHESAPKSDHTYQSDQGHLMMLSASVARRISKLSSFNPRANLAKTLETSDGIYRRHGTSYLADNQVGEHVSPILVLCFGPRRRRAQRTHAYSQPLLDAALVERRWRSGQQLAAGGSHNSKPALFRSKYCDFKLLHFFFFDTVKYRSSKNTLKYVFSFFEIQF